MATFASFKTYSTELDPLCTFLVGFSENLERSTSSDPLLKEIKININDLIPSDFEGFNYTPTIATSAYLVGYADNDERVAESDPVTKTIKVTIDDILSRTPFRFTSNELLLSSTTIDFPKNVGYFDNEVVGDSYGNILLSLRTASNSVYNGTYNAIINSGSTNLLNANFCTSILTFNESISGEYNISVGGSWNEIDGQYNSIFGTASDGNTISGISVGIFNSVANILDRNNDFTTVVGGGLNTARNTDLTSLINTLDNTVSGTIQCNIFGGEGNRVTSTGTDLVSAVTLIGVYNRNITPANSFYTITNNLSVLNDFSSNRFILTSPNGSRFSITVNNSGTLSATPL